MANKRLGCAIAKPRSLPNHKWSRVIQFHTLHTIALRFRVITDTKYGLGTGMCAAHTMCLHEWRPSPTVVGLPLVSCEAVLGQTEHNQNGIKTILLNSVLYNRLRMSAVVLLPLPTWQLPPVATKRQNAYEIG